MNNMCYQHMKVNCDYNQPQRPKNEFSHRMARKAVGLTICVLCNDSGYVTTYSGGGAGLIGCQTHSHKCGCRCFSCDELATNESGVCDSCPESEGDAELFAKLKDLF